MMTPVAAFSPFFHAAMFSSFDAYFRLSRLFFFATAADRFTPAAAFRLSPLLPFADIAAVLFRRGHMPLYAMPPLFAEVAFH